MPVARVEGGIFSLMQAASLTARAGGATAPMITVVTVAAMNLYAWMTKLLH